MVGCSKDYNYKIIYHPCKANIVADALRRKTKNAEIKGMCLRMKAVTSILEMIKQAQSKEVNKENRIIK